MRLILPVVLPVVLAAAISAVASNVSAQTWGQPYGQAPTTTWGQPRHESDGPYGVARSDGRFGNPYAYRPPVRHDGYRGEYGQVRAGDWTRWSSPPGRGYHDVYGYNDDRAPRVAQRSRSHSRSHSSDIGAYLYDR